MRWPLRPGRPAGLPVCACACAPRSAGLPCPRAPALRGGLAAVTAAVVGVIANLDFSPDGKRLALTLNSAVTALVGLTLGLLVNRKWLALTAITSGFLAQHTIQGWCPPLPLFRKLGYRTRKEIEKEK